MLRDATLTSFIEVLGANSIPYELNKSESVVLMKETGSRILFRAVDDFERLRGTNLAWFGLDELTYTTEEAWLRLEGRLRDPAAKHLCGFAVWTPKGYDWVYRRFLRERVEGYEAVLAKPFENRHILDRVPDFYERLKNSYDTRFFQQEVLGEYLNLHSGLVYQSFDRNRNVKTLVVNAAESLFWALDFNVDPMSSVVVQKTGGEVQVLDEIVLSRATTFEACEEFHSRYPNHSAGVVIYGDASGKRMQTSGTSDYQIIKDYFRKAGHLNVRFKVPMSNPSVRERVLLVNSKLRAADDTSELFVDPRCKELIRDLEEVLYKPNSNVVDKERDPKRTHLSDALGYVMWQECRPQTAFGEQGRRLL
jgi:hypothetical protein